MIEWIECNLPWQAPYWAETPDAPDLSEREREVFGFTNKEKEAKVNWEEIMSLDYRMDIGLEDSSWDEKERKKSEKFKELQDTNTNVKVMLEYKTFEEKYEEWWEKQPEIKSWIVECDSIEKEFERTKDGFCDRGLNKPGTLIELDNGKFHLIGSINSNRGICDDCVAFDNSTIVKRYRRIWIDPSKAEK